MKKISLIPLLLFAVLLVDAQENPATEDVKPSYRHEIGLNFTTFVQNILGFSGSDFQNESPYLVTYKYHFKTTALRFGIGGELSTSDDKDTGVKIDDYDVDFRLGYELQRQLSHRWTFYAGLDFVGHYSTLKTTSVQNINTEIDKVTTSNISQKFGGGPNLGVQFNIHPRLNVSTDASLYFFSNEEKRKVNSSLFPEFNTNSTENSSELQFTVPFSIFLKFRL